MTVHSTVSRLALAAAVAAPIGFTAIGSATAQEPERGQTIFERPRPDYDPRGIPLDGFLFLPRMTITEEYDTNVFATNDDEDSDFVTVFRPEITARSRWSRHSLSFNAYFQGERYLDFDDENANDYGFSTDGRLDVTRRDTIGLGAAYIRRTEGRTDPDQGGGDRNQVDEYVFDASYRHEFNRIAVDLDSEVAFLNFIGDDLADRDRTEYRFTPRVTYTVSPRLGVFAEPFVTLRDYDNLDDDGSEQDSTTTGILFGADIDLGGILFGEVGAGVFYDTFEDDAEEDEFGFALDGELDWNVTDLTTVTFQANSGSEATDVAGASSLFTLGAGVRVEHELRRNILLDADVSAQFEDFQGSTREDDVYEAGLGIEYLVNRNFAVFAGYDFFMRSSSVETEDFSKNVVSVGVRGQF
ncbi:MAG: outer membrane beta-barrel protein [Azospirillaceae bacterium]